MKLRRTRYRSGIITLGAAGIILASAAMAKDEVPSFSELDRNNDERLAASELEPLASHHQKQSESILKKFDENDDDALSQQEYSRAVDELPAPLLATGRELAGAAGVHRRGRIGLRLGPHDATARQPGDPAFWIRC